MDIINLYIHYYHLGPLDGARKRKKCGKRKGGEEAGFGGQGRKGVEFDGIGKMRGKGEGETDILKKGQAMRVRFC